MLVLFAPCVQRCLPGCLDTIPGFSKTEQIIFDDKNKTVSFNKWREGWCGLYSCCGYLTTTEIVEYANIGNYAYEPTGVIRNETERLFRPLLITKEGKRYSMANSSIWLGLCEDECESFVRRLHKFTFGQNNPYYMSPSTSMLISALPRT